MRSYARFSRITRIFQQSSRERYNCPFAPAFCRPLLRREITTTRARTGPRPNSPSLPLRVLLSRQIIRAIWRVESATLSMSDVRPSSLHSFILHKHDYEKKVGRPLLISFSIRVVVVCTSTLPTLERANLSRSFSRLGRSRRNRKEVARSASRFHGPVLLKSSVARQRNGKMERYVSYVTLNKIRVSTPHGHLHMNMDA